MAVDRNRKIVWREITSLDDVLDGKTLDQAIQELQERKADHPEGKLDWCQDRYSDQYHLVLLSPDLESDEEMQTRIAREEQWDREQEDRDRRQYEALRKRFGG